MPAKGLLVVLVGAAVVLGGSGLAVAWASGSLAGLSSGRPAAQDRPLANDPHRADAPRDCDAHHADRCPADRPHDAPAHDPCTASDRPQNETNQTRCPHHDAPREPVTFEGRVTGMAQCGDHVVPADNPLAQNPRHALPDDVGGATYRLEATGHGTAGTGHLCVAWLDSDGHRLDPSDHAHHVPHHAATAVVLAEFEVDTPYELEISWG